MIQVINVISILNTGQIDVKSFTYNDNGCELSEIERLKAINDAEKYFIDLIKEEDDFDVRDTDNYLDEGHFKSYYGNDYYLIWSF